MGEDTAEHIGQTGDSQERAIRSRWTVIDQLVIKADLRVKLDDLRAYFLLLKKGFEYAKTK